MLFSLIYYHLYYINWKGFFEEKRKNLSFLGYFHHLHSPLAQLAAEVHIQHLLEYFLLAGKVEQCH